MRKHTMAGFAVLVAVGPILACGAAPDQSGLRPTDSGPDLATGGQSGSFPIATNTGGAAAVAGTAGAAGAEETDPSASPLEEGCTVLYRGIYDDTTLTKRNVAPEEADYCIDEPNGGFDVRASLVVEPGVVVAMTDGTFVEVLDGGSLKAIGLPDAPVVFTGVTKGRGAWPGLRIETVSSDNVLDHVIIEHAGTGGVSSLRVGSYRHAGRGRLSMTNTIIRDGAGDGLAIYDARLDAFAQNTITGHDGAPVISDLNPLNALDATSTYSGNAKDWVVIQEESLAPRGPDIDVSLARLDVPYRVANDFELDANLAVAAGVTMYFEQDAGLMVRQNGSLTAVGTAETPVVFDSTVGVPGSWVGIDINSIDGKNRIEHAHILNGGAPNSNPRANVVVRHSGTVLLSQVLIAGSGGWGVYQFPDGRLTAQGVTYMNNALGDLGEDD